MITWNESEIIIAVIGFIGVLSTFAVVQRSFKAVDRYERRMKKQKLQLQVCEVCDDYICECE